MKTIRKLRTKMGSYCVPSLFFPNASPALIQSCICRICSYRSCFKFGLEQHMDSFHPVKWANLGNRLDHNRMPDPRYLSLVTIHIPGSTPAGKASRPEALDL